MHIDAQLTNQGIAVNLHGEISTEVPYELKFPEEIWRHYSGKEFLLHEIAYVATLATPLIVQSTGVTYSTARPRFYRLYNHCFEHAIPNMTQDIPWEDPHSIRQQWGGLKKFFRKNDHQILYKKKKTIGKVTAIMPFSYGKDSLLSLGLLSRMGYDVIPISINEFMLPRAWKMKMNKSAEMALITGMRPHHVENEIQLLSDYEVLGTPMTRLYQVQAHFMYVLAMLPFCEYYGAANLILNNELMNSLPFIHRCGTIAPRRFMQGRQATSIMRSIAALATSGRISLLNIIGGLGDFAIHYLLQEHFKELAQLRISCHMELTRHTRWCHGCERCARAYLFTLALGKNVRKAGFTRAMAGREFFHFFNALSTPHRHDTYRIFAGAEERLACAMAREQGHDNDLIKAVDRIFPLDDREGLARMKKTVFGNHDHRFLSMIHRKTRTIINPLLMKMRHEA